MENKYFDSVLAEMQEVINETNLSLDGNILKNDTKSVKIEYIEEKQLYTIAVADVDGDNVGEYKQISAWLFDDSQTAKDAAAVGIDFSEEMLEIARSMNVIRNKYAEILSLKINKELKFSIEINESIPKKYYGDTYKIYKILCYILLNAIEYTNYGEVKLIINGKKVDEENFEFEFVVANTGHTMSVENFNKSFEDYKAYIDAQLKAYTDIKLRNTELGNYPAEDGSTEYFLNVPKYFSKWSGFFAIFHEAMLKVKDIA